MNASPFDHEFRKYFIAGAVNYVLFFDLSTSNDLKMKTT